MKRVQVPLDCLWAQWKGLCHTKWNATNASFVYRHFLVNMATINKVYKLLHLLKLEALQGFVAFFGGGGMSVNVLYYFCFSFVIEAFKWFSDLLETFKQLLSGLPNSLHANSRILFLSILLALYLRSNLRVLGLVMSISLHFKVPFIAATFFSQSLRCQTCSFWYQL